MSSNPIGWEYTVDHRVLLSVCEMETAEIVSKHRMVSYLMVCAELAFCKAFNIWPTMDFKIEDVTAPREGCKLQESSNYTLDHPQLGELKAVTVLFRSDPGASLTYTGVATGRAPHFHVAGFGFWQGRQLPAGDIRTIHNPGQWLPGGPTPRRSATRLVGLTKVELDIGLKLAATRTAIDRNKGCKDRYDSNYSGSLRSATIGYPGELAFCKEFNLYPNLEHEPGFHDAVSRRGCKIDVKTTKGKALNVLGVRQQDDTDMFVLMISPPSAEEAPGYVVAGEASPSEVFQERFLIPPDPEKPNAPRGYRVPAEMLRLT